MAQKKNTTRGKPEKEHPITNRSPWFPPDSALHRGAHQPEESSEEPSAGRPFYTPHPDSRSEPST